MARNSRDVLELAIERVVSGASPTKLNFKRHNILGANVRRRVVQHHETHKLAPRFHEVCVAVHHVTFVHSSLLVF